MKLPNRNQIMLAIGLIVAEGPDVAAVATWLGGLGIPNLAKLIHFLGWLSTALASAALAWPGIRARLAAAGLTTPPGALAPWDPAHGPQPALIPLLDGSSVIQVSLPTVPGGQSLSHVAVNPTPFEKPTPQGPPSNTASVIPMAPMPTRTPTEDDITRNLKK
jgi:hypothetical protein